MRRKTIIAGLTTALFLIGFAYAFAQAPAAKPAQPEQPMQPAPGSPGERLARFLDLTPEQVTKLTQIRKAMRADRQAFREEMTKLRPQLREALRDPNADTKKVDGLIDQMSQLRAARLKSTVQSLRSMKSVLTPEQFEKFREMRSRMAWRRGFGRGFGSRRWSHPGWGSRRMEGWAGALTPGFSLGNGNFSLWWGLAVPSPLSFWPRSLPPRRFTPRHDRSGFGSLLNAPPEP